MVQKPVETTLGNVLNEAAKAAAPKPKIAKEKKTCKSCGTTTTPQWRRTNWEHGPVCNACYLRIRKEEQKKTPGLKILKNAQKKALPTKAPEKKETAKERSARIRNEQMAKSSVRKQSKPPAKKAKEPEFIPPAKEEVELSVDTFLVWGEQFIPGMIMRDKSFLVATKVIETWFTTLKSQHEYDSWLADNLEVYLEEMRKIFKEYEAALPTLLMVQDAGDNVVLMVNNPRALTTKLLEAVKWV